MRRGAHGGRSACEPGIPRTRDEDPADCGCVSFGRAGSGAVTFHRLMAEHGAAEAALAALPGIARAAGVEDYALCPVEVVRQRWRRRRVAGARLLLHGAGGLSRRR